MSTPVPPTYSLSPVPFAGRSANQPLLSWNAVILKKIAIFFTKRKRKRNETSCRLIKQSNKKHFRPYLGGICTVFQVLTQKFYFDRYLETSLGRNRCLAFKLL